MPDARETSDWRGLTLLAQDGDKVGRIQEIYVDRHSGEPEWALVETGLLGLSKRFVPLKGAEPEHDGVRVPVDKALVRKAPSITAGGKLTDDEERRLYEHYDGSART